MALTSIVALARRFSGFNLRKEDEKRATEGDEGNGWEGREIEEEKSNERDTHCGG